jgi:hypothetical protein
MEPLTVEIISHAGKSEIKVSITCRSQEEFDDLARPIQHVLLTWHEKYYPLPDLFDFSQIGVEKTRMQPAEPPEREGC